MLRARTSRVKRSMNASAVCWRVLLRTVSLWCRTQLLAFSSTADSWRVSASQPGASNELPVRRAQAS
eukprot:1122551-Pelagomonas_calceolata.AAC.1